MEITSEIAARNVISYYYIIIIIIIIIAAAYALAKPKIDREEGKVARKNKTRPKHIIYQEIVI